MLPKANRLSKTLFASIFKEKGTVTHSSHFFVTVFPLRGGGKTRFACVVSKKSAKTAVLRNRTRRRFYRIFSTVYQETHPQIAVILSVKKGVTEVPYSNLREEVIEVFKKARITATPVS